MSWLLSYNNVYQPQVYLCLGFLGDASGEELPCQSRRCKRCRFNLWVGRSPRGGSGNPFQYSCLENPMDRGAQRTVHRVAKSWTWLKWLSTHTRTHIRVFTPSWVLPLFYQEQQLSDSLIQKVSCLLSEYIYICYCRLTYMLTHRIRSYSFKLNKELSKLNEKETDDPVFKN